MDIALFIVLPVVIGWLLDRILGDPVWLPHPIVFFGKVIVWGEKRFNKENGRLLKGGLFAVLLILLTFVLTGVAVYFL